MSLNALSCDDISGSFHKRGGWYQISLPGSQGAGTSVANSATMSTAAHVHTNTQTETNYLKAKTKILPKMLIERRI